MPHPKLTLAIAECIREVKTIPSGHLYSVLMEKIDLETYSRVVQELVKMNLVKQHPSHLLEWIGKPQQCSSSEVQ